MIEIEGYHLVLPGGRVRKFDEIVIEAIPFDQAVIVRVATESARRTNENVYGVDFHGNLLWQIPWRSHPCEHSPYVSIYRSNNFVDAYNWDGHDLMIHPQTGLVLRETYLAGYSHSRRQKSVRQFI